MQPMPGECGDPVLLLDASDEPITDVVQAMGTTNQQKGGLEQQRMWEPASTWKAATVAPWRRRMLAALPAIAR